MSYFQCKELASHLVMAFARALVPEEDETRLGNPCADQVRDERQVRGDGQQ